MCCDPKIVTIFGSQRKNLHTHCDLQKSRCSCEILVARVCNGPCTDIAVSFDTNQNEIPSSLALSRLAPLKFPCSQRCEPIFYIDFWVTKHCFVFYRAPRACGAGSVHTDMAIRRTCAHWEFGSDGQQQQPHSGVQLPNRICMG